MHALLFLNVLMTTRLVFILKDQALTLRALITLGMLQLSLCVLLFSFNLSLLSLMAVIIVGLAFSERLAPASWLNEARLISLGTLILGATLLRGELATHGWLTSGLNMLKDSLWQAGPETDLSRPMWYLFGALLLANEINLVIRTLFHRSGLEPQLASVTAESNLDEQEYNAGRIIGILERWLIYTVLVASDNFSVVAVIIAAKGVARFRQLEERAFAEYVLVGTLASTLATLLVVQLVRP